jgi:hypothetical protein
MDCEKFDQHVIDALYDELDELTFAALKRHVEGCSRCAGVWAGLRATRDVGILPLEEPPADLEDRIMEAVAGAQKKAPWHKKVLRGLAWAGSHAMRPQLAMAALFFLVIGSSLLLLRARPGTMSPVSVRERGTPAPEATAEAVAAVPQRAAAAATAAPSASPEPEAEGRAQAVAAADDTLAKKAEAPAEGKADSAKDAAERGDDARAALNAARATRSASGCAAAIGKLDAVAVRFPGTQAAADAMWEQASCYKEMGDAQKAQQLYLALRSTGYRDRAEQELAAGDNNMSNQVAAKARVGGGLPANAAAAPAPAAAPSVAAAETRADRGGGPPAAAKAAPRPAAGSTNPRATAAPKRALDNAGF